MRHMLSFNRANLGAYLSAILDSTLIARRWFRRAPPIPRRDQNNYYRAIIERANEGILIAKARGGRLIEANPVLLRKLGYAAADIPNLCLSDVLVETVAAADTGPAEAPITLARTTREVMQRSRDGRFLAVDVSVISIEIQDEPAICYVIRDATPRKVREGDLLQSYTDAERRANFLAHRDSLTGLANRSSFKSHLREMISQGVSQRRAVLLFDIDGFSSLNDTLGADVGDTVLLEVANRLREMTRDCGYVARVGSDEFAVVLYGVSDASMAARMALDLQAAISSPIQTLACRLDLTAHVGISLGEPGDIDVDAPLNHADLALSSAKAAGRGSVQFFNSQMNEAVRRRLDLLLSLRHALDSNELAVHFQPIVDIGTRRILSLEALVRWEHPRLGTVAPADFIAVAEQSGLIVQLGERVLRLVCKQIARWRADGEPPAPIAVNVSPQQFQHRSMSELIQEIIGETGINASDLAIEITEGSLMRGADRYLSELRDLRAAGVRIVVDDFGTGYSSLSYLKYLPLDTLKIDRSFIANVDVSSTDEAIVSAILALARSLGLNVIAEGVEMQSQLAVLARHGCQMAQGYYFSKPLPAEQCVMLLRELARAQSFMDTIRTRAWSGR